MKQKSYLILLFACFSLIIMDACETKIPKKGDDIFLGNKEFILKSIPKGKVIKDFVLLKEYNTHKDTLKTEKLSGLKCTLNLLVREYSFDTIIKNTNCTFIYKSYSNVNNKYYNKKLLFELNDFLGRMKDNSSLRDTNNFYLVHIDSLELLNNKEINYVEYYNSLTGGASNSGNSTKYKLSLIEFENYKSDISTTSWRKIEKHKISSKLW